MVCCWPQGAALSVFLFTVFLSVAQGVILGGAGPQISSLNILLPPLTLRPVRYRLQGVNGCFTWSWDHHDIINVTPEFGGHESTSCATSAIVTSVAPYMGRRKTAIQATDMITGQVLRCEVFVDRIEKIRIFHNSLKLDLDGLATLVVRGFDAEDNVFSSLVGLQFLWQLSPLAPPGKGITHRLSHVPIKESTLLAKEDDNLFRIELEENALGSDAYVVRGVSAGPENVTAVLVEDTMDELTDTVVLTVAEAFSLSPTSPVYIIPGTKLQYTVRTYRRGTETEVQMPSPFYRWSAVNDTVAIVDSQSGLVVGRALGKTDIKVEDVRVLSHEQTSALFVVMPISLRLILTPLVQRAPLAEASQVSSDSSWQIVLGRSYIVQTLAFSRESGTKPLVITKDNDLRLMFNNPPIWESEAQSQGWRNSTLLPRTEGRGTLVATLATGSMIQDATSGEWIIDPTQVVSVEQEVVVCAPVQINVGSVAPPGTRFLNLPWFPRHSEEFQLTAEGACGNASTDYRWSSSNVEIVTVDKRGVVSAVNPGKAFVRATALRDPLNFDEIPVEVSYPTSIQMVPGTPVEEEVGSVVLAAVVLLNSSGSEYSSCSIFQPLVQWSVASTAPEAAFVLLNGTDTSGLSWRPSVSAGPSPAPNLPSPAALEGMLEKRPERACAVALLWSPRAGPASVTAVLDPFTYLRQNRMPLVRVRTPALETSWSIAAYLPLTVVQLGDGRGYGGYGLGGYDAAFRAQTMGGQWGQEHRLSELLLALGSSIKVALRGGPDRWRPGIEFVESCDVATPDSGSAQRDVAGVLWEHLTEGAGRVYRIGCTALGTHSLTFRRGNVASSDHAKRAVAVATLSVVCAIPSSVVLLVDDVGNQPAAILASEQLERDATRMHLAPVTVVNGRKIRIAAVALNENSKAFANASSLALRWDLMGGGDLVHMGTLEGEEGGSEEGRQGPWESALILSEQPGQCIIRATADKLHKAARSLVQGEDFVAADLLKKRHTSLTDAARLKLVTALRLEPESYLLYYHPQAKALFTVVGGTSEIQPSTNDTRVAEIVSGLPVPRLSSLVVASKGLGTALITVQDVGLAQPVTTSATVTVADVAWVRMLILEDAMLLLGSNMTVLLEAGDSTGRRFDPVQFALMRVQVHLHEDLLELISIGEVVTPDGGRSSPNSFRIRGRSVGPPTPLHVSIKLYSGKQVLSESARVTVYAPLTIHPPWIIMAPGSEHLATVHGGPLRTAVHFSGSNSTVATIDPTSGLILARAPGNMTVTARAQGHGGEILCEATILVRVLIPGADDFELFVRSGKLGVGYEMDVYPIVGTTEGFDPMSFAAACWGYTWSPGDDQVLSILPAGSESSQPSLSSALPTTSLASFGARGSATASDDEAMESDFSVSARIFGRSAGWATVSLTFQCFFPGEGQRAYKASGTVWVVPEPPLALGLAATWLLPTEYTSTERLPQSGASRGGSHLADGTASVVYSIMHDCKEEGGPVVSINGGRLQTGERTDIACIHARDKSTGRGEVAACVRVAEVGQMTVGHIDYPFHAIDLSLGASHHITVTLRDDIGAPFTEVQRSAASFAVDVNRPDVVSATVDGAREGNSNFTLHVQAHRQGTALIRVRVVQNPHVVNFVMVQVNAQVSPQKPTLHVGGRVTFTVHGGGSGPTIGPAEGRWTSGNESVLRIRPTTGEAEATGEGSTTVAFVGPRLTTQTTVSVVRVATVVVEAPQSSRLPFTNIPAGQSLPFLVTFRDQKGRDMSTTTKGQEVPFQCEVEPPGVGRAVARREGRQSFCDFLPSSPQEIADSDEADELAGTVRMAVLAVVPGALPVMGKKDATFVGGFAILGGQHNLHLSPSINFTLVTLVGNVGGVIVSAPETITVKRWKSAGDPALAVSKAQYKVKVKVKREASFSDKVVFKLPDIDQGEELQVKYSVGILPPIPVFFIAISAVLGVIGVIFFFFLAFAKQREQQHQIHHSTSLFSPFTPAPGAPPPSTPIIHGTPIGRTETPPPGSDLRTPATQRGFTASDPFFNHIAETARKRSPFNGY